MARRVWICLGNNPGAADWEEIATRTYVDAEILDHGHSAANITSGLLALARGGTNADLSATGGATHFLRQASAGAAVTVGAIAATDLPTAIDAAKLADGSVSNTEFQYLNGVTLAIQTQLDAKQPKLVTHATNAPGVNDDNTQGYVPFVSLWWEQDARVLWLCIDATTGAADWAGVNFPL